MSASKTILKVVWEQNRGMLIVLATLLIVCTGLFLTEDQFGEPELERLRLEQSSLQQQLRQQQQQVTKEGMPLSAAGQIAKDLSAFHKKIPTKVEFADFIGDLFAWATKANLVIRQVSYQPKVDPELGFLQYGLNFSVKGTYAQLKKFIHLLENSSRILIIDSISLSGRPGSEDEINEVALNIKLTTYFQEEAR